MQESSIVFGVWVATEDAPNIAPGTAITRKRGIDFPLRVGPG
jgi:hypothetical protein